MARALDWKPVTQAEKARALGVSLRTFESWMQGRRKPGKLMIRLLQEQDHDCGSMTGDGCQYCGLLLELGILGDIDVTGDY